VWWVTAVLAVWLAGCIVAQTKSRASRWLAAHNQFGLFPHWHLFYNPPAYYPRVLVRICDPFGEVCSSWADAVPLTDLRARHGVFNPRLRFDKTLLDLSFMLANSERDGDRHHVYKSACVRLQDLVEWSIIETFDSHNCAASLSGYAFQVAMVQMRERDAHVVCVLEPKPLRLPFEVHAS
jgi:hypothetical protein